jgi:signal transduction histidine kinase
VILQSQRDRLAMEQLNTLGTPIAVQVKSLVRTSVTVASLQSDLKEQAQDNNIYILFADSNGNVLSQISPGPESQRLEISADQLPHNLAAPYNGKLVTAQGDTYLFAAFPIVKAAVAQALARYDMLVLATPPTSTSAVLAGLTYPFLTAGLAVLAVSLIIAIFLSRSIYRPINRVRVAAEKMAEGNYEQAIPVAGPGEVRELASSFNKMAIEVKSSHARLRHYVADVSHQLKSPLTSIHGFAQALLDGTAGDDTARQRAASIISDESQRMKRQVDELLELARMQAGQLKIERELVNLNELLEHCREVFEVQAEEKNVKVRISAGLLLPCAGDFDRLEQAFSNILDNAIKNSPYGDEIRILGRNVDKRLVEVRVVDNGPGIPSEQLQHLFERFYQSGGARSGHGLGLAIAREIVVAHGGTIDVKSEPGEGAVFIITLPAHPANK